MTQQRTITHGVESSTLADILERVLDKGIVIAGDIKIKLVDVELLTLQIRLVICSVDKAMEIGINWWVNDKNLTTPKVDEQKKQIDGLVERLNQMESKIQDIAR